MKLSLVGMTVWIEGCPPKTAMGGGNRNRNSKDVILHDKLIDTTTFPLKK